MDYRIVLRSILLIFVLAAASSLCGMARIEATGELPADARDGAGDTIGGIGSGIAYHPPTDQFLCVTDRGPGDGAVPYRPRLVWLKLIQSGDQLKPRLIKSIILRDERGQPMTGLIPDDDGAEYPRMEDGTVCIDPEAIAIASDGTFYITDEYGPYLYQFSEDGKMLRRLVLPEMFRPKTAKGRTDFSAEAKLVSGRDINRGPEGMCLLSAGNSAALIFQSGLAQNGGRDSTSTYILVINLADGSAEALYEYPFTPQVEGMSKPIKTKHLSVNDMAALEDGTLLVLERDKYGQNGAEKPEPARYKAVWQVDYSDATNLLRDRTNKATPVQKRLLMNLPDLVENPGSLSAKWESIVVLPPTDRKVATLLLAADNDFLTPIIFENGSETEFPNAGVTIPTQFIKVTVPLAGDLPEK